MAQRGNRGSWGRRVLPPALVVVVAAAILPGAASPASSAPIEPRVLEALRGGGTATFWVELRAGADLEAAAAVRSRAARGRYVYDRLRETAARSQAGLRALLAARGVRHDAFWIANTIRVTAGADILRAIAARPEVERITADRAYRLPELDPQTRRRAAAGVEWGIDRINAPAAWEEAGTRGEGIVVASIDSGVQFDHPALAGQYRGNNGNGGFEHDYNWFDPSYVCGEPSLAPCDNYGHGTHVTGTMVGDDGAGNQIGVAPGARWIAAKGCETDACSRYALLAAGQWVLAPTDLAGENPDPSRRPHIVNSSWGISNPFDTFYRDTVRAWLAAGIFPVFANGNTGPSCGSVGAPASYPESFGVGAFAADGTLASFSSRGPAPEAVGGALKPQLAAPGVGVRSAFPGSTYAALNGTSMAAPHVSGTIALMWSASPRLERRIDATREILAASAIDAGGDECGGTAANNNGWGEGRLDARAAVAAAPPGAVGTLEGRVTEAGSGDPVAGATVTAGDTAGSTGDDGRYRLTLPVGTYELRAEAFGYAARTVAGVEVEDGATRRLDLALDARPTVQVSGTVRDGSGQGWPLAARVTVAGDGAPSTDTDPVSGRYSLRLPADAAHTLRVEARYPGYRTATEHVEAGATGVDFELPVEADACTAPGYRHAHRPLFETFDAASVPPGWEVVDHAGTGQRWRFDDPIQRGNNTGGDGPFALVDSFQFDLGPHDTSLVTPVLDLSDVPSPAVGFRTDFFSGLENATAAIDVSADGGGTWETVWQRVDPLAGPAEVVLALPQLAGRPQARVRFHFTAISAFVWKVDDVFVGTRTCDPRDGGLVVGDVRDRNTGAGVGGATVTLPGGDTTSSAADGFYWLFSPTGSRVVSATARDYVEDSVTVDVEPHAATPAPLALPAGRVGAPDELEATVEPGRRGTVDLSLANTGSAPVRLELTERDGGGAEGTATGTGAPLRRIPAAVSWTAAPGGAAPAALAPAALAPPWRAEPDYPIAVQDNAVAAWGGKLYSFGGRLSTAIASSYVYDPATERWETIAPLPEPRQQPAGAFIDGKYYVTGGWDPSGAPVPGTRVYDPATDRWSAAADNPAPYAASGAAVLDGRLYVVGGCTGGCGTRDVLRYDPESDAWETLAPYPQFASWLACGGLAGKLYCAGGVGFRGLTTQAAFAYDPETDAWTRVADMPADFSGSSYVVANDRLLVSGGAIRGGQFLTNEGVAYDPRTDSWSPLPNARHVRFRGGAGCGFYRVGGLSLELRPTQQVERLPGYGDCGPTDVPWLTVSPRELTLAPGEREELTLAVDALPAGTYRAALVIEGDTPYGPRRLPVTLHVQPARDDEPPRTTATLDPPGGASDRPVTVALSASDGGSGVARTEYRIVSDGRPGGWRTARNSGGAEPFRTAFTVARPGAYTVSFRSVDVAGNVERTRSIALRIATPPPAAGGTPPPGGAPPAAAGGPPPPAADQPASFRLLRPARRLSLAAFGRRGLRLRVACSEPLAGSARLAVGRGAARRLRLGRTTIARGPLRCTAARTTTAVLEPSRRMQRRLRRARRPLRATLRVRLAARGERPLIATRRITLTATRRD